MNCLHLILLSLVHLLRILLHRYNVQHTWTIELLGSNLFFFDAVCGYEQYLALEIKINK